MKRLLLMKSLLVAAGLLVGASAWADEVVGTTNDAYLASKSTSITVSDGGSINYKFSQTTAGEANYQGFVLVAKANESEDPLVALRCDNFETVSWSNACCTNNFDWTNFPALMNGASYDMTVTYSGGILTMNASVTGSDSKVYTYSYEGVVAGTPSSLVIYLSNDHAQLNITKSDYTPATPHYNVNRYSQDYEDATTYASGWSSTRGWAQGSYNGGKVFYINYSANRNTTDYTLSFADNDYFKNATDYEFAFQYAFSVGNGYAYASSLAIKDISGNTLFSLDNAGNYANACNISYGETNISNVYFAPYNKIDGIPFATFVIRANETEGVILSIGGATWNVTYNNNKNTERCGVINPVKSVRIADFAKIGSIVLTATGGASHFAFDNMIFKEHSDVAVAEDPTFSFKSVSGDNRVYTITNPNDEGTLYYTTVSAAEAPAIGDAAYSSTSETTIDVPYGTGTYYAYTVLGDGTTTSGVTAQAVTGGAITLNTPTWNKTAYNPETGVSTVTLTSDQSNKLGTPEAIIYYSINDATPEEYSTSINVSDGEVLKYYAVATGYVKSSEGSVTAVAPFAGNSIWNESYSGTDKGISVGDNYGETGYKYMVVDEANLSDRLLTNSATANNFLLRNNGIYTGGGRTYAITNLEAGQYVVITATKWTENPNLSAGANLSKDVWNSTQGTFCFNVTNDGIATFSINRYCTVSSITIKSLPVSKTITAGWATYCSPYALDLEHATGLTDAYIVTGGTSGVLATSSVKGGTVAANTGLLLKGTAGTVSIPVVASGTDYSAKNKLMGVIAEYDLAAGAGYVLLDGDNGIGFYKNPDAVFTVGANTAYLLSGFDSGSTGAAPAFYSLFDSETTGIGASLVNSERVNNEVFNLNGQRVSQPTKGLYIVNGKKIIVK